MRFRGRLAAPGDPGGGVAAQVGVEGGVLTLTAGDEPLGRWPLTEITVDRVGGSRFAIHVQNENLVFAADDPLAFSYEGIPLIEEAKRPVRTRWWQAPKSPKTPPREVVKPRPALTVVRPVVPSTAAAVGPAETPARPETQPETSVGPEPRPSPSTFPAPPIVGVGCRGRRRDGMPCRAAIVGASGYCYLHDPATRARRTQAPRPVRKRRPGDLNRLYQRLQAALDQLSSGELAPERAGALAALVGAMCDLLGIDSEPLAFAVTEHPAQVRTARQING